MQGAHAQVSDKHDWWLFVRQSSSIQTLLTDRDTHAISLPELPTDTRTCSRLVGRLLLVRSQFRLHCGCTKYLCM